MSSEFESGNSVDDDSGSTVIVSPAETPPETHSVQIPGYEIIQSLGKGGMGMVYLARQIGVLEREVALKTILPKHEDEVFRSYFLREGQRQAKLHHPNILPIFSAGESGELLYLSVYYARNGSLRDRMDAKEINSKQAADIVCDVLSALHHAHSELDVPMAHLDIKPENILFDGDNVFLADFGIAKLLAEEGTVMGVVAGDPRYWPPEQQLDQATTKSDIYALGVMFFEMLSGKRPEANLRSVTTSAQEKALARKLPTDARLFAPLIAKCLNPNTEARPDADLLRRDLRRLITPRQAPRKVIASALLLLLFGIGLSQPGFREFVQDRWAAAFPAPTYPVTFSLTPVNGKLWVDGQEEPLRNFALTEGEHRVVAVAPGHLGKSYLIEVDEDSAPFELELLATPEASDTEYQRFISSFDGSDRSHDMEWREPTLKNVVDLDRMEQEASAEFDLRVEELEALAFAGDEIAATSLFYAAFEGIGVPDGPKTLMQGLVAASEKGYPVASLLRALYIVQTLLEEDQTFNLNPYAFEEVETLLLRVAEQGMPETASLIAQVAGITSIEESRNQGQ